MLTQEIRRAFLKYFQEKGHTIVPSSPVIPYEDPTLLFTNAGMNQFKDVFLGSAPRDYKRAASSQKCVRVGGKHNDLENVGHTSRHLTFFEMLGNFSFGDYFKKESIQFAWEVSTKVFQFDPDLLWPSVFVEDDEAFELWKAYVPEKKITRLGEKDNFWAMGDTGPCGPSSELYYDRGKAYGDALSLKEDVTGERYIEFWNLVFMQYSRSLDGKKSLLPQPSIDTGAGLERVVCLKLGVDSLFETDILRALIAKIESLCKVPYHITDPVLAPAFRVIADHVRTLSFAIADGAQPSNVDRGYVLRKILRRAVRYGKALGFDSPFLANLLPPLIATMGSDYPELQKAEARIAELLTLEEEAFFRTLKKGGALLTQVLQRAKTEGVVSGEDAFKLKDTYGLPFEEIALLAKDSCLKIDELQFQALEKQAKERSKGAHKTSHVQTTENIFAPLVQNSGETLFLGYQTLKASSTVVAISKGDKFVESLGAGEEGIIILDKTPFYAEMGGQVGDIGQITSTGGVFQVNDTKAPFKGLIGHFGKLQKGKLQVGDAVETSVDPATRQKIANNHTATHLLHLALQKVLGTHIKQAGSVVDQERLRFDFNHHKLLSSEEIQLLEDFVNAKIRENSPVQTYEIAYEEAKTRNDIKQFFGEKYGNSVRVVETGDSKELCGGTHTQSTGNIGYFRILKESSIAAGVRRIEAVTGKEAENLAKEGENLNHLLASLLKTSPEKLKERVEKLLADNKVLEGKLERLRKEEIQIIKQNLIKEKETIRDHTVIASLVSVNVDEMKMLVEELIPLCKQGLVLLGASHEGKASLVLRISDDLVAHGLNAAAIIRDLSSLIEGSGGGKPHFATAGGKKEENLPLALLKIKDYLP